MYDSLPLTGAGGLAILGLIIPLPVIASIAILIIAAGLALLVTLRITRRKARR